MQIGPTDASDFHHHVIGGQVRERLQKTLLHLHHGGAPFRF